MQALSRACSCCLGHLHALRAAPPPASAAAAAAAARLRALRAPPPVRGPPAARMASAAGEPAAAAADTALEICPPAPPIDEALFRERIEVAALRVPAPRTQHYVRLLGPLLLDRPRLRKVLPHASDPGARLLLLDPAAVAPAAADLAAVRLPAPAAARGKAKGLSKGGGSGEGGDEGAGSSGAAAPGAGGGSLADLAAADGLALEPASVEVGYSYFSAGEALRRLLPPGVDPPAAFETVGHIAHLNLREELEPHGALVGRVILDKHPRLRTVLAKVGAVESEFRTFRQRLLAGDPDTVAEVRQHGCTFRLDYARVYWNSRLEREHARLVDEAFAEGDVVLDACAGVGPFAVPAARRRCRVLANDLNPESHRWLAENVRRNGVGALVATYCMDARDVIRAAAGGRLPLPPPPPPPGGGGKSGGGGPPPPAAGSPAAAAAAAPEHAPPFQHVVMNLPASAVSMLDAFRGAFDPAAWAAAPGARGARLPLVHVYTFSKGESREQLVARVEAALGGRLDAPPGLHAVRDVAPGKVMYCVTFRVPAAVAFAAPAGGEGGEGNGGKGEGGDAKRQRVE